MIGGLMPPTLSNDSPNPFEGGWSWIIIYLMEGDLLKRVLSSFQKRWGQLFQIHVMNMLAYGSGAFPQTRDKKQFNNNTLDLIVEVRQPSTFHRQIMSVTPQDYSGAVSVFGSGLLSWTGNSVFPMHSNHITIDGKNIKYSVVGTKQFRQDLKQWKYMSFAGRLQKPVAPVKPYSDGLLEDLARNREIAAAVALLLFGGKGRVLSQANFFSKICEISYLGDIRFAAGAEDPLKIDNIVSNNYQRFQEIYLPILKRFSSKIPTSLTIQKDQMSFLYTVHSLAFLLPLLPISLVNHLSELYPGDGNLIERILLGGSAQLPIDLKEKLKTINRKSSFWMAAENFVSASPINNLKYLAAKWKKKGGK